MMRFGSLASFIGFVVGAFRCHWCDGFVCPGAARRLPPTALWNDRVGRRLDEVGHDYTKAGGPIDPAVCTLSEKEIHALIRDRQQCRRARDFKTAGKIVKEMNQRGVRVNDKQKTWRADKKWRAESIQKRRHADPDMRDCNTLEEMVDMAYSNVDHMSPRGISAFWNLTPKFLQQRPRGDTTTTQLDHKLGAVFDRTLESIEAGSFGYRYLATVAIGWAKIMKNVGKRRGNLPKGGHRQILYDLLVVRNRRGDERSMFHYIARASLPILSDFDPRHLSNLIYAFGLADVPEFEGGDAFYNILAEEVCTKLECSNSQDISNIAWAYATMHVEHSDLFQQMGDTITARGNLESFKPQELSNIAWAYATAKKEHPKLFEKVANHIIALGSLERFTSQALSNIAWAYATTGESHPKLFEKVANRVVSLDSLESFEPQAVANIAWAYATANESHPKLFEKVADHIVSLGSLERFKPRALATIAWAYATTNEPHPELFEKMADHIASLGSLGRFKPQDLSNIAWAYATADKSHPKLFDKIADHIISLGSLERFRPEELSNISRACATANEPHPELFVKVADHIVSLGSLEKCDPRDWKKRERSKSRSI